ncbi:TIGR03085 family metal-binding protein [Angustibacter aerolatus]
MSRYAQSERQALSDTLLAVGPDQPTECEGWLTRDLATHLVVRDRRPDLQAAMLVPPLRERAERGQEALAGRPWTDLVEDVRSGPPAWSPLRLGPLDEAINTAEFFVHHEDVRRAQPDWAPRELDPDLERALWSATKVVGRLALRTAPVGVELVAPGLPRIVAHRGHPVVRVEGAVAEVVLFAFGRRRVARVELDGAGAAVEQLRSSTSGR